jgi:short-subunit dehydrogenase
VCLAQPLMGRENGRANNRRNQIMSKTIFITGAGSGLGRGAAIGLAKKGHKIIATTEITPQKTDLLREARDLGLDMEIFKLDITNERDRAQIEDYDFDIFVANAAINEGGPLGEVPMDRFRALFEVNVFSTLETVQIAARKFVKKGSGKIIFMSSMAGISATPYVGPYTATKHAIEGIAQTLKSELEEFGVKVATINPGAYNTGFNDRSAEEIWKWYDEDNNFTRKEDMLKQQEGLKHQFDPEDMIEKMIEIIPADHHKFRTVHPQETEEQLKKTQQERWEMEI